MLQQQQQQVFLYYITAIVVSRRTSSRHSAADAVTNLQTFEPTSHSSFYPNVQGSLHRGFPNALTRVDRGSVLQLCSNCIVPSYLDNISESFQNCTRKHTAQTIQQNNKYPIGYQAITKKGYENVSNTSSHDTKTIYKFVGKAGPSTGSSTNNSFTIEPRRKGGCRARGKRLLTILEEITISALQQGQTVHLTGHSLGGGLASHMALDLILNIPTISVSKLHLWTFGAPQIVDSGFLESAVNNAPRLQSFITGRNAHRFVTVSDNCLPDVISEVAKKSLPSHKLVGFHGKVARKLGGVSGHIVHFTAEPHYLLTPQQFHNATSGNNTKTYSTMAAHSTVNYLHGISRESKYHPLQTDLPQQLRQWLGEVTT